MDCEHMEERISAYLDGELTPEEQLVLEEHVANCSACASLLEEYKELSSLVQSEFRVYTAPFDLEANVYQQIDVYEKKRQSRRMRATGLIGIALLLGCLAAILLSPVGIAVLSVVRLIVRVIGNLLPLLWYQAGSPGLLSAGIIGVGAVVTVLSLFAMKKMMQSFVPGRQSGRYIE